MSNASSKLDPTDLKALRTCAAICWQRRAELHLADPEVEQVLIAWMSIGNDAEAEAATEVLSARRESELKQSKFDGLLGG